MRILGIDPGTREFAWAIYDTELGKVLEYQHVTLDKKEKDVDARLRKAEAVLQDLIRHGDSTDLVAYEKMFSMGNAADAPLAVFAWMVRQRAYWTQKRFIEIPHTSAYKEAVGDGKATKEDVKTSLEARLGETFPSTDVSDAVAIAVAGKTYHPKEKKPRSRKAKKTSEDNTRKKP